MEGLTCTRRNNSSSLVREKNAPEIIRKAIEDSFSMRRALIANNALLSQTEEQQHEQIILFPLSPCIYEFHHVGSINHSLQA